MFSWFWKGKADLSPGGSKVLRYGAPPKQTGSTGSTVSEFREQREAVYDSMFGEASEVYHEVFPAIPHIDVYVYPAREGRKCWTLVTGGMSDVPMNLPVKVRALKQGPAKRVELIFYCTEPRKDYQETLRQLAHFPHTYQTWIGPGHTMPNGNPPAAIWEFAPKLDTLLFMPSIVSEHRLLPDRLTLGGDPVEFLWMVPLTGAECEFKLEKGYNALLGLFEEHRHPHVFDPERGSYV